MSLQPVADEKLPGLWRSEGWKFGVPGVYALIIGASRYPHLDGGEQPAKETFGLGQLSVSASTAMSVFDWLRGTFRNGDMSPVWCQLLLSPTKKEAERFVARGVTHYGPPTYDNVRIALQRWSGNLPEAAAAAARSRTFFFFSGHGVSANWLSLLLPSDYLDPSCPNPQLQNCISAREIRDWMSTHGVGEHLALFDACRNEFVPLASKGATANTILETNPATGQEPRAVAIFASTAPKATAYQSAEAGQELSFFGTALLEGLRGGFGQALSGAPGATYVEFNKLVGYVKPRVNALLKARNEQLEQTGRSSLEPSDAEVVLTDLPEAQAPSPAVPKSLWVSGAQKIVDDRFTASDATRTPLFALRDIGSAHARLGHEFLSLLWSKQHFHVHELDTGKEIPDAAVAVVRTEQDVKPQDGSAILRVDLELPSRGGGILAVFQHPSDVARGLLAVPLPTDEHARVPVRLTLTLAPLRRNPGYPALQRVEARLGPSTGNPHYQYLWSLTQRASLGSLADAAASADPEALKDAVQGKLNASTAAMAGALLLARGGRILDLGGWTRNLMDWFPLVPDGAVLWAESLRASLASGEAAPFGVKEPLDRMVDALASLLSRGVPFFAETIDLADALTTFLLFRRASLSAERLQAIASVRKGIRNTLSIATPNGHFVTFAGLPRPDWLPGDGPLSDREVLAWVRPRAASL